MSLIAVAQIRSGNDPWLNLLLVDAFVREATARKAESVYFPESVFYRGPRESADFARADIALEFGGDGFLRASSEFSRALAEISAGWEIPVSLGSFFERDNARAAASGPEFFNTHGVRSPGGAWTRYRKIHLFDYQGASGNYRESNEVLSGSDAAACAIGDWRVGLSVCYDLRFPELYRSLALGHGCQILTVPAAFTMETGPAHWHALLRARAIENLSYVVAAAQWGSHRNEGKELFCYGHSIVYDPWGNIIDEAPETGDALLVVKLEREVVDQTRRKLPSLQGAKFFQSIVGTSSQT